MVKKSVLLINNAKVFLHNFGGYSRQIHHLFHMFDEFGYALHYLTLCLDLQNGCPFTTPYQISQLRGIFASNPFPFVEEEILERVTFFSNQNDHPCISPDRVNEIVCAFGIDLVFFLGDVFMFRESPFSSSPFKVPSMCWYPCHYFPITDADMDGLRAFSTILCLTPSIKLVLEKIFPDKQVYYLPHVTEEFPTLQKTRLQLRERWGQGRVPLDAFLVLVVASLYEITNRKAIDVQILAFQKFREKYPDANAFLFIHSASTQNSITTTPQAFPLHERAAALGLDPSAFHWNQEVVTAEQLGEIYAMSDVLLSCSKSEGFGVPILEAQRYGLKVITSDFLSMKEHNFQGRVARVATESYNFFQAGAWTTPSLCAIVEELEKAHKDSCCGDEEKETRARWIVRKLTSFHTIRHELALIIK